MRFIAITSTLLLFAAPLAAQDHGRVLATAMDVAPGKLKDTTKLSDTTNYVFRGRVIALDKDRAVSLCFDTEHMRVAGVWVGKPVVYTADKNMGPAVEGTMLFSTRPGPGWGKLGRFDDPRRPPEGPLPRDWAHYRGLYLAGDRAVLAYDIGGVDVLEEPSAILVDGVAVVSRTFNVGPSGGPLSVLLFDEPTGRGQKSAGGLAEVIVGSDRLVAGIVGAAPLWKIDGGRVQVTIPPRPNGQRVRIVTARLPAKQSSEAVINALKGDVDDLAPLTRGGPPRWSDVLETKGTVAADKAPYVVDTIELPTQNPWKSSVRFGGLDFFPDGRAALCTWDGDVWIASGLDGTLDKIRWKRFASGLQQPLGLKIVKDTIHVAGRDQITRLVDLNNDGEADFYENFNNDAGLTLQRHEFVLDLETDTAGNFYYGRSGHYIVSQKGDNCCVQKVSPDGKKMEIFARGFREPNGLSIGPDGTMTVADNEGNGVPQTPIYRLKPGGFYGFLPSGAPGAGKDGSWTPSEKPIVWLPTKLDRSAGGQIWAPKTWGPLGGQLLHTSYGDCVLFAVLIDKDADPWQGAVWKLPLSFESGIMRGRFHPLDQQLYLCGLRGWGTIGTKDGQFCRVRATGMPAALPVGVRATKSGLAVTFSSELDRKVAADDQNWGGNWSVVLRKDPGKGDEIPIERVTLSKDGRTATVELERVMPVANYSLQYRLKTADGAPAAGTLYGTIHRAK